VLKQASDYLKPHKRLAPKVASVTLHPAQSSSIKELKNH
jgi:hypothetical protein